MASVKTQNPFTEQDYKIVRTVMRRLTPREFKIVFLRFWGHLSLVEIARELRMTFQAVDQSLSLALEKLKGLCLQTPGFSRCHSLQLVA